MKRIVLFAAFVLGLMALTSSSASIITKSVNVAAFDKIVSKGKFDIKYLPGEQSVKVCGPESGVNKFKAEVTGGVLTLDSGKTSFIKNDKIVVYISTGELKSVKIEGAGDFEAVRGISGKDLSLTIAGAGDIEVKNVEVESLSLSINGAGDIDAEGVDCETIEIVVNGAGDVEIEKLECRSLTANINGAGDAEIEGRSKEADITLNGAGSIDISKFSCENLNSKINGLGKIKRN